MNSRKTFSVTIRPKDKILYSLYQIIGRKDMGRFLRGILIGCIDEAAKKDAVNKCIASLGRKLILGEAEYCSTENARFGISLSLTNDTNQRVCEFVRKNLNAYNKALGIQEYIKNSAIISLGEDIATKLLLYGVTDIAIPARKQQKEQENKQGTEVDKKKEPTVIRKKIPKAPPLNQMEYKDVMVSEPTVNKDKEMLHEAVSMFKMMTE